MQFTYKIENYSPYESRIFVVYTPVDTAFEPLGGWVMIGADWTEQQIKDAVVYFAPLAKWEAAKSPVIDSLIGVEGSGVVLPPEPPPVDIQKLVVDSTQARLDDFAKTKNYDGILSACTYATSSVPTFKADADYCVAQRDATWAALYALMADVQAGTKPMPTSFADVESLLPTLAWPA